MRYMKWVGLAAALLLLISCFLPWVFIESRNITVTGTDTTGTRFGKPAYFHLVLLFFFIFFHFKQRVWAKRANLLIVALNIAWAVRNFLIISACHGGDCPVKEIGLWLVLLSSIIMLISALFPDMKIREQETTSSGS